MMLPLHIQKKACKKVQGYLKYFLSKPNIIKGITLALRI